MVKALLKSAGEGGINKNWIKEEERHHMSNFEKRWSSQFTIHKKYCVRSLFSFTYHEVAVKLASGQFGAFPASVVHKRALLVR